MNFPILLLLQSSKIYKPGKGNKIMNKLELKTIFNFLYFCHTRKELGGDGVGKPE
jgi:hypothetical protein